MYNEYRGNYTDIIFPACLRKWSWNDERNNKSDQQTELCDNEWHNYTHINWEICIWAKNACALYGAIGQPGFSPKVVLRIWKVDNLDLVPSISQDLEQNTGAASTDTVQNLYE